MSQIYNPPTTSPEIPSELEAVPAFRALPIVGSFFLAGPLFGLLGTIFGLIKAFSVLPDGNANPAALAEKISLALMTTTYGVAFGLVGVILVSIALFRRTNREPWFYKCVSTLSIFWFIMFFPIGLIIGIYLLVSFHKRKNEFYLHNKLQPKIQKSLDISR